MTERYSLKVSNTCNLIPRMNDGRCTTLGPHQNDINHVRCRWHRVQLLEIVYWHVYTSLSSSIGKTNKMVCGVEPLPKSHRNCGPMFLQGCRRRPLLGASVRSLSSLQDFGGGQLVSGRKTGVNSYIVDSCD